MTEHEHAFIGVPGGRMYVTCDRGHEHDVDDCPPFEVCHCGAVRPDPLPPYPCPNPGLTQRELLDLFDKCEPYPGIRAAIREVLTGERA